MEKIKLNSVSRYIFFFLLLCGSIICIYQNSKKPIFFKNHLKIVDETSAIWKTSRHYGNWKSYAEFLKEQLFIQDFPERVLMVPDCREVYTESQKKMWSYIIDTTIPYYLFPIKIETYDSCKFKVDKTTYERLMKLPLLKKSHDKYTNYFLVKGFSAMDYKIWITYFIEENNKINIFTLPTGLLTFEK